MRVVKEFKFVTASRLDQKVSLSSGLRSVLGVKKDKMNRFELMDKLIARIHFLRLHNVLSEKNYKIPKSWQKHLNYYHDTASEEDLLVIMAQNIH